MLQSKFAKMGMLVGTTASYMVKAEDENAIAEEDEFHDNVDDEEPIAASGNPPDAMSDVKLTLRCSMSLIPLQPLPSRFGAGACQHRRFALV